MNERSQLDSAGQCEVALASRKSTLKGLPDGLSQPTKRPEDPALLEVLWVEFVRDLKRAPRIGH